MIPSAPLSGGCWILLVSLLLACYGLPSGAQEQEALLQVELTNQVVSAGGSLMVNCSTNCFQATHIKLETFFPKKQVGEGQGWVAFQLSNVTDDSQILCSGFCNSIQMMGSSNITVYRLPELVDLAPLPPWQPVGQNLTLHCKVVGGAPQALLTVVLLQGKEELTRQPAEGKTTEVTFTLVAKREDHGADFSCRTELDLRHHNLGLLENSSAPRLLQTFVWPVTSLHLVVPRFLEVGKWSPVDCSLDELFPVSKAQVHLALGDQMLNASVSRHEDTLKATAIVRAEQEGVQEVVCNVTLGDENREQRENLTFYSFPGPILTVSQLSVPEGTTVKVTCAAGARVHVTLDGISATAPGQPVQFQLTTTKNDDRHSFFCSATLEVDGEFLHKNMSVQLRVLYGPKIVTAKCPQHLMWKERTIHVLQCQARGNPEPQLKCSGRLQTIDRNPLNVTIVLAVFVILGLVITIGALVYVFRLQKWTKSYHVKQESTWLPLKSTQPDESVREVQS